MSRIFSPSFKRLSSTFISRPSPSKTHLHQPIPSTSFPKSFVLTGIHSGVKKDPNALDLAVILSTSSRPTAAAASFTKNAFQAAPVLVSREILKKGGGYARSVVINSGCANAVTGKQGLEDAWSMVHATDSLIP